jgi:glutamate-1-semialdehyde 2,1-aminomutase
LYERSKLRIPGGVNSPVRAFDPYPFFTEYAKGSKIVDVDGHEYIDYCLAYGPIIFGHAHPPLMEGIRSALARGGIFGTPSELDIELVEMISKVIPSISMVRLVNSGAEATMHAIRLARGFTNRDKVLRFEGSYHGAHDSMLVKSNSDSFGHVVPGSLGIPTGAVSDTLSLNYDDVEGVGKLFSKYGNDIAAIIVEPVMTNSGLRIPQEGFLKKLRQITKQYGSLLIFDEVVTGFRVAIGGAQEYFGIEADLVTYGKVLGGGFPIGAIAGRKEVMMLLSPVGEVYQAGTFSGNPISVVASIIILKELLKNRFEFYSTLEKKRGMLQSHLRDFIQDREIGAVITGFSSMFHISFRDELSEGKLSSAKRFSLLFHSLLASGVFIPPSQLETCFLSASHDDHDLQTTLEITKEALLRTL